MLALSLKNILLHVHVHLLVALLTLHVSIFHFTIHAHYKHGGVMTPNFPTMNDRATHCRIHARCTLHTIWHLDIAIARFATIPKMVDNIY